MSSKATTPYHKFEYQELIELGFKRKDDMDSVFFNHTGYQPFHLTLNLTKKISLEWDSDPGSDRYQAVRLYRKVSQSHYKIVVVRSESSLHEIIDFFSDKQS